MEQLSGLDAAFINMETRNAPTHISGLVVYDHHDILYAYGPLDDFRSVLASRGIREGEVSIPSPHSHWYHAAFAAEQDAVLAHWDWRYCELQPRDDD